MGNEKEEKKSYTFQDRRGLNDDRPEDRQEVKIESAEAEDSPAPRGSMPKIDFATLIMSFASASMISLGKIPEPATGTIQKNLLIAQQNIDIITLLKDKTQGNLAQDEERLLDQILYELRMYYIEAMKEQR